MTSQDTKKAFAEIIAKAQALAESQNNRGKSSPPKPTAPKKVEEVRQSPELSTTTIDDILSKPIKSVQPQPSLTIVNYSDKAIVVVGDTYANRVKLKSLGGRYNKWLKCGEGWVFPKTAEDRVKREFSL